MQLQEFYWNETNGQRVLATNKLSLNTHDWSKISAVELSTC